MIDQKLIIENPTLIQEKLAKKGCVVDFTPFLNLVSYSVQKYTLVILLVLHHLKLTLKQ